MRAVVDFEALGERTVWLDCDVLQADGGTRCAAICGAYVAARRALDRFGLSKALTGSVAAVSVGIVDGEPLLDLDYAEDSTRRRRRERRHDRRRRGSSRCRRPPSAMPFTASELDAMLDLAAAGIEEHRAQPQQEAVDAALG